MSAEVVEKARPCASDCAMKKLAEVVEKIWRQAPLTEKQPLVRLMPLAAEEVAVVRRENTPVLERVRKVVVAEPVDEATAKSVVMFPAAPTGVSMENAANGVVVPTPTREVKTDCPVVVAPPLMVRPVVVAPAPMVEVPLRITL